MKHLSENDYMFLDMALAAFIVAMQEGKHTDSEHVKSLAYALYEGKWI